MPNKTSNSGGLILRYAFRKMGIPTAKASDDGGEFKGRFKEILDAEGIDHIIMTTHLSFIGRFTRTMRVQHNKKEWRLLLPAITKQYNTTIHDSTKLKPIDASKDSNAPDVKTHLVLRSRFKSKFEEINVGVFCRIFFKRRI